MVFTFKKDQTIGVIHPHSWRGEVELGPVLLQVSARRFWSGDRCSWCFLHAMASIEEAACGANAPQN